MASRAWSNDELELIERHASTNDWKTVLGQIPDRTMNAVKVRMSKLRSELGFEDGRRTDDYDQQRFEAKTAVASQQLLSAIERAGVRP